jgi:glycyl-tRNA synthetase beta chain
METQNVGTGNVVVIEEKPPIDDRAIAEQSQPSVVKRPSPTTLPLLLEVGCEEIPARFLADAEKALGERVQAALSEARLLPASETNEGTVILSNAKDPRISDALENSANYGGSSRKNRAQNDTATSAVQTYSTPRRLVVHVPAVLRQQPDKVEEIVGPPVKVAIDSAGKYTRAAESFAQKNAVNLEDLTRTTTPKGEYLSLRKTTHGRPAREVLAEILPGAILGISFPKSMYWREKSGPRFVRPVRWVLALLGEGKAAATVDFEIVGVKSGDFTFGHRAKSSKRGTGVPPVSVHGRDGHATPLSVKGFKDYTKKLAQAHVEIDKIERQARVFVGSQALLEQTGLKSVEDEWLTDWIVNSTEWPRPVLGTFDERFLHLPREILITVMRDHQRYFAVEDQQGRLTPRFVAVLNMDSDPEGVIRQGHQRVVTARFRDAEFFWKADQKIPLRERLPLLDKVTYQAKLGSYGDKVRRMLALGAYLCDSLNLSAEQRAHALRAIELCKCDLTTQMVQEFTELQGIVGGLYAQAQGEPEEVAAAIYDHYLPLGLEGKSPRSLVGAVVSLADKLDSVVAGFAIGQEPTGSSDPFALRRQANGIIKVILDDSLAISLSASVSKAGGGLEVQWRKPREEVLTRVMDFLAERLRFCLSGFRYDTVRAVLAAASDDPADARARAEAMEALRGGEDFEALSAAAKRIRNILAKSASAADWQAGEVSVELLAEAEEKELYAAFQNAAAEADRRRAGREYRQALEAISTLRPTVDRFFDKVLVMAEDRAVRENRLRLLKKLDELFSGIALFAEIAEGQ